MTKNEKQSLLNQLNSLWDEEDGAQAVWGLMRIVEELVSLEKTSCAVGCGMCKDCDSSVS